MNRALRLLLTAVLLIASAAVLRAQTFGNEWIDYGRTYLKFKVGRNGVYRINQSTLSNAGVPATTAGANFRLYRDGQEVALFTTTAGTLGSNDYLEFFGRMNDGSQDQSLFPNAAQHPNSRMSLFADTAAYFLTYDGAVNHLRYTDGTASIPSSPASTAGYCWSTVQNSFRDAFMPGRTIVGSYQFFSSAFDNGEGFIGPLSYPNLTVSVPLATPNAVAAPTGPIVGAGALCFNYTATSNLKVFLNSQQLVDTTFGPQETRNFTRTAATTALPAISNVSLANGSAGAYDSWGVSYASVKYPRNLNFTGLNYFEFNLEPVAVNQYLELTDFITGGVAPRLYDITNNRYYTGDISVSGKVRFYLAPSLTERQLVIYAQNSTLVGNAAPVKTFQFTNYNNVQGNYVIITHPSYRTPLNGQDVIDAYRSYRASATGGGYSVVVADIEELYDQFIYGIDQHPYSIQRFARFAAANWTTKPEQLFVIGKGVVYNELAAYRAAPATYGFKPIPTYGNPGSDLDLVNFGPGNASAMTIGRLSAGSTQEIRTYLDKVQAYEIALQPAAVPTAATELWKKRALHIAGASDMVLQPQLLQTLNDGAAVIRDTLKGSVVTTVAKNSTNPVDPFTNAVVDSLINSGMNIMTFHGHASSVGFDYNINTPEIYTNRPRLPFFMALGCDVAQIFELSTSRTISERYINTANGGAITMVAADNLGFTNFHPLYLRAYYYYMAGRNYSNTMGSQFRAAYDSLNKRFISGSDYPFWKTHLESMLYQGDPGLKMYAPAKPDYHVANSGLSTIPANVTTETDSFRLRILAYNLGKAVVDSPVVLRVEHISPAGVTSTVRTLYLQRLMSTDTLQVWVPVNDVTDIGLNRYRVTVDATNHYDEISEINNTATLELFIYNNTLVPVYPKEFSIVRQQGVTLKGSTLNAFRPEASYRFEIDTTEAFNSSIRQSTVIRSAGGVIKWTPTITLRDSTVYYWRTAFDSLAGGTYQWGNSSFVYMAGSSPGWNQSHYYQYGKDGLQNLEYGTDRTFRFSPYNVSVKCFNKIMLADADVVKNKIQYNEADYQQSNCYFPNAIQIMVIDPITGLPWRNTAALAAANGSEFCPGFSPPRGEWAFEFRLTDQTKRIAAKHFLDSIPAGHYVLVKNSIYHPLYAPSPYTTWMADTAALGSGQSLYHSLRNMGFSMADSMYDERPFIFWCRKGTPTGLFQIVGANLNTELVQDFTVTVRRTNGTLTSSEIGPAKAWDRLQWRTGTTDTAAQNDTAEVRVIGIAASGIESTLFRTRNRDTSIAGVSTTFYPRLRLEWNSIDANTRTSTQLAYWRVLHAPAPEAALVPARHFAFADSLEVGQTQDFSVAIENISDEAMDSVLVRYRVINASNVSQPLADKRYRPLPAGDTLHASINFDPAAFAGANYLFVEANPENDQPEQYHPNNLGYVPFNINTDRLNPLIDVTFDGVHILDRDIVSAKPFIKILLKDDSKYLALDDTSLIQVYLQGPNDGLDRRRIAIDGTTCRFIPANITGGKKNEAYVEYRPSFTDRCQGQNCRNIFSLFVKARDKSGNSAGPIDYQTSFEVIYESSITRVLNYPNPFSTATAFVFTLTGAEIPSQFKIQVLTVTGKVVREITKQEIGPIHVGRNVTEYQWDGRDQYGQLLGNGVYLYRVVTSINGSDVEHRESGADKFFQKGWGKMYIMR